MDFEPIESLTAMSKLKDWMRKPECMSSGSKYYEYSQPSPSFPSSPANSSSTSQTEETCCGLGIILAPNVDIFYWPKPGADTACLNTVGSSANPLLDGATTSGRSTYWGCTALHPQLSTELYSTITQSIITLAQITVINSLTFKKSLINPWSSPPCAETGSVMQPLTKSSESAHGGAITHARSHSLVIPTGMTHSDGMPVSTLVSGDFTFTSPSVYANFHNIQANDWCGPRGSQATIPETMLAFAPGELSTIAGPFYNGRGTDFKNYPTKVFNFDDLPCPPQSVMEENWYSPAPGEPYRPLIALPSKVKEIDPMYAGCSDAFFTALDPPRTLEPSAAMVSPTAASVTPTRGPEVNAGTLTANVGLEPSATSPENTDTQQNRDESTRIYTSASQSQQRPSQVSPHAASPAGNSYQSHDVSSLDQKPMHTATSDPQQISRAPQIPAMDPVFTGRPSHTESMNLPNLHEQPTSSGDPGSSIAQMKSPVSSQHLPLAMSLSDFVPRILDENTQILDAFTGQPLPSTVHMDGSSTYLSLKGGGLDIISSDASMGAFHVGHDGLPEETSLPSLTRQGYSSNDQSTVEPWIKSGRPASTVADKPTATIESHPVEIPSNGAAVNGNTVSAGAAPLTFSGGVVSMDLSNHVHLDGTIYDNPVPSNAQSTPGASEATMGSKYKETLAGDLTMIAGAPAITYFGEKISLDSSSNLILSAIDTDIGPSLASQVTTTLASNLAVSSGPIVSASETILSLNGSGNALGGLILGGLHSGGPSFSSAISVTLKSSSTVESTSPKTGPAVNNGAESRREVSSWMMIVPFTFVWLSS